VWLCGELQKAQQPHVSDAFDAHLADEDLGAHEVLPYEAQPHLRAVCTTNHVREPGIR
jgi:hypothetical protein